MAITTTGNADIVTDTLGSETTNRHESRIAHTVPDMPAANPPPTTGLLWPRHDHLTNE